MTVRAADIKVPLTGNSPGAVLIRRFCPFATVGLLALGGLRWWGQSAGLYPTLTGVLLMAAGASLLLGGLVWHVARSLNRADAARRDAAAELQHKSRHFELSHDMVCTAGFDGVFRELNTTWAETLGWTQEELCSRPFVEFVHPEDRERTMHETAGLAEGKDTFDFANRYATKDGRWRWLEWKSRANLETATIYASARDVTDRMEAQAALKQSEAQTRLILATANDAFVAIDSAGLVIDWNPQAELSFGRTRAEAIGQELASLIIPEGAREAHRSGLTRFLATGQGIVLGKRLELAAINGDGREFPVELTIAPLATDEGYVFNAFVRDITDRKRGEEALAAARDRALDLSDQKSMFVATASHELKTPINGVIGLSELLLDTDLDDEQRRYAQTIASSGEALVGIINNLLDFSKIEAGGLDLDLSAIDLRGVVERAHSMLGPEASRKGIAIAVTVAPELPALVRADGGRLGQVIANFLSNAVKFTTEGEVALRLTQLRADSAATLVRLEVSDSGIGIDQQAVQRLFEPYSQADGSTTRLYGGTGLGLAISKQLIELMDGQIGVESTPGRGSTFWFEVLLAHVEPLGHGPGAGGRLPSPEPELLPPSAARVLMADDAR